MLEGIFDWKWKFKKSGLSQTKNIYPKPKIVSQKNQMKIFMALIRTCLWDLICFKSDIAEM